MSDDKTDTKYKNLDRDRGHPGPGLCHQVVCRYPDYTFHITTWLCTGIIFFMYVVGLGTEYWASSGSTHIGVFRGCVGSCCGPAKDKIEDDDFLDSVAALEIIGFIIFLGSVVIINLHIAALTCVDLSETCLAGTCLLSLGVVLAFLSGVLMCTGCLVFNFNCPDHLDLDYSWYLCTISSCLSLFYWIPLFINEILEDRRQRAYINLRKDVETLMINPGPTELMKSDTSASIATTSAVTIEKAEFDEGKLSGRKSKTLSNHNDMPPIEETSTGNIPGTVLNDEEHDTHRKKEHKRSRKTEVAPNKPEHGPVTEHMQTASLQHVEHDKEHDKEQKSPKRKSKKSKNENNDEDKHDKKSSKRDKFEDNDEFDETKQRKKEKSPKKDRKDKSEDKEKSEKTPEKVKREKSEVAEKTENKERSPKKEKK